MSCCDKKYDYSILWRPIDINKCRIRNRISMSGMGTFTPTTVDQVETESGLRYYEERAKGGIGLIHTGAYFIDEKTAQGGRTLDFSTDKSIPSGTQLTERVHRWGAKIFAQLSCGTGRNGMPQIGERVPISSSENPSFYNPDMICRALTIDEIEEMMEHWKVAAQNAVYMGFDGIQIHAHAGYLMDQFMSEIWNHRTDKYGGSFENRCRFTMETVDAIRSVVGPDFPITYRISLDHRFPGGRTIEESMKILDVLDKCGIDAFDIDAACYETMDYIFPTRYTGEACMAYVCEEARKHLTKPIINTGNHSMESAVALLESGNADIAQFGRQSIADPQFANKLREGRREDVRPCIVCNEECIGRIFGRLTQLSCTVNPSVGFETAMEVKPVSKPTNVVVIGGGPGGLEAARCAAERGCSVTLYEKGDKIGGTFLTIATGDFKWRIPQLIEWYGVQLKKLGVKVVLNAEIKADDPVLKSADAIFVATGSKSVMPKIPGIDNKKVVDVVDIHKNGMPEGERVVICGGGLSACDTAIEYGAKGGRKFTIVEMLPQLASDVMVVNKISIDRLLNEYGVEQLTSTKVIGITDEGVEVEHEGEKRVIPADVIVAAFGRGRSLELADAVQNEYPTKTVIIGDCMKPAKAGNAIREGFYAAMSLK
ncbi:MAG TPA: FAD-dependent oxidoreductase [Candidatus Scatomorpha intestinavium]|uniref:FAD-dependent oxidoreductase n=1 Tax=Candidatus Scatomorpha intestinavium TaxID=2840922 RepID=A0A9D0ZDN7_9FIRM|nr:FAD-dependent oxidoreductase [Candidatus Scatomorpha intestinavium]